MKWFCLFLLPVLLFAKPKQPTVVSGTAAMQDRGAVMEVKTSDRAIIHWKEFSIGSGETTRFVQPNSHSAVLNRVAQNISQIDGLLQGNGKIYLLNPNGILIGPHGRIEAESFIGSTLYLNSEDFQKNKDLLFKGTSQAKIVNLGTIDAIGGDVFLLAKGIVNQGSVLGQDGVVGIAAGSEILLKPSGMQRLFIAPAIGEKEDGGIENQGRIEATKAELRADGNAFRFAINQSGVIEATGTREENGSVFLVAEKGTSVNSGTIIARGGKVHILGNQVGMNNRAVVDVSSDFGGGEVLIGGDFQGKNPDIPNAKMSVVMEEAQIFADATGNGDGGKIIVWSDDIAVMKGKLFARGGSKGGDGGFVEVSGLGSLHYEGHTNTLAPAGKMGDLLLDPSTITIANIAANINITFTAATGVYTATAATAQLDTTGSMNALFDELGSAATNITVTTTSGFAGGGDVIFNDGGSWNSANSLTVMADRDIILNLGAGIVSNGTGSITFTVKRDIVLNDDLVSNSTGSINLTAARDLIFQGLSSSLSATNSSIDLTAGRDMEFVATGTNIFLADRITMTAGNDITIGIQGSPTGVAQIRPLSQDFTVTAGGNLSIFGSNTAGFIKRIDLPPAIGPSLTAQFVIGGNLVLEGGSQLDNVAVIGGIAQPSTANMFFTVGGNVVLTGGSGTASYAQVGFISDTSPVVGGITFNAVGGSVTVTSGSGTNSYAQIGHANGGSGTIDATGNIVLNNVQGNITLQANTSTAMIGDGNLFTAGGDTYTGKITVEAEGDIKILASNAAPAAIGFLLGGAAPSTVTSEGISIAARNLDLIGQNEIAFVGHTPRYDMAANIVSIASIDVVTTETTRLQGVNLGPAGSALIGQGSNAPTRLSVRAGDISLSTGFFEAAGPIILSARGTISSTGLGGVISTGSLDARAGGNILLSETSSFFVQENIFLSAGQNISLSSMSTILTSQNLTAEAGGSFLVNNSSVITGTANITAGRNIEFSNANVEALNDFLALAGDDFLIQNGTEIVSMNGSVILVADNNNPDSPEIGDAEFILDATSTIDSATLLRIYTASRSLNTILGLLNGLIFTPGPSFIDSATEQWDSYFPKDFGGVPFTIFYKDGLPKNVFNDIGRVISEMFQDLKIYDRLLFRPKCFLLGYDKACYDQLFLPKGMISSFDLYGDRATEILQQYYRNYHTLWVESF